MERITACTMDCPDSCSLIVTRQSDGCVRIRGNPDHPITRGFICKKIQNHGRRLQSPNRIRHPLKRIKGGWRKISWDAALDLCGEKIDALRGDPTAILQLKGEGAKGVLKQATRLFFAQLGASRIRGSLCDAAGIIAGIRDCGSRDNNDVCDILNAGRIVNWGKSLGSSSIHLDALVRKARRNGARVLAISPGGEAHPPSGGGHVRILPGTDRHLAAAVMKVLIERQGIPPAVRQAAHMPERFTELLETHSLASLLAACDIQREDLERVVACYRGASPTATIIGSGLQRYRYGGENVRFLNALAFISGNFGRSGGGSYFHLDSTRNLNMSWMKPAGLAPRRALRLASIGEDILAAADPPIRMIWVNGTNVVNQALDSRKIIRAFDSVDFKVVVDAFMTDTARQADLILPSTLMLEQEDIIASFLHDYVHHVAAVCQAPGEARSDFWIISELNRRLGAPVAMPKAEDCLASAVDTPQLTVSLAQLREQHIVRANRPKIAYEGLKFDHADGKFHFPATLHEEPGPDADFPLRLLTLIRHGAIHSQILPEDQTAPPRVWVAPDCPVLGQIDFHRDVFLVSELGRLRVTVETKEGLHPRAVLYRRGDWIKFGGGVNQLICERVTDIGNGAAYYGQFATLKN